MWIRYESLAEGWCGGAHSEVKVSPEASKRSPFHTKDEPGSIRAWTAAFIDRRCSYLSYVLPPLLHRGGQAPCRYSQLRAIFHKRLQSAQKCVWLPPLMVAHK